MAFSESGTIAIAVSFAFGFLAFIAIAARCYVKIWISKNFGLNDVGILTAYAAYNGLCGLLVFGVDNGVGGPLKDNLAGVGNVLKTIWFFEILYVVLTSVMKGSIAITMMQWTRKKHPWLTKLLIASIFMDVIISTIFTLYVIFQCQPISHAWELAKPGKCLDFKGQLYMGYALSAVTLLLDILMLTSPIIILYGRGVNRRLKCYIFGLFGLGIAASTANIIRLFALLKLTDPKGDKLLNASPVFTYSNVEVCIGLIIAGLIELGPLMAKYNAKGFDYYSSTSSFSALGDDEEMRAITLQEFEKEVGTISHPMTARTRTPGSSSSGQEFGLEQRQAHGPL